MGTVRNTPLEPADPELDVVVEVDGRAPRRPRRRGRPPESDGLTEQRILEAARICFAESGYAGTSTHAVAARANLTTGALYHYFDAKRDLFVAVFHQVEELVYQRFRAVTATKTTLSASIAAMLDEMVRLHRADSTLGRFMQTVTADVSRHVDLHEAFQVAWPRRDEFLQGVGRYRCGQRRVGAPRPQDCHRHNHGDDGRPDGGHRPGARGPSADGRGLQAVDQGVAARTGSVVAVTFVI
jgi:AcrR family transcriptional regulator